MTPEFAQEQVPDEERYGVYVMVAIQERAHPTTDLDQLRLKRNVLDRDVAELERKLRQARAMRELYGA